MGRCYSQLSVEERCEIARLRAKGAPIREVATSLDRPASTVARELKRNGSGTGYRAVYAQEQARARRWSGARLERNEEFRNDVLERLKLGWSPETVAGRLKRERGKSVISYESIYRFIYAQSARHKDYGWRHYLRRKRWKRGRRRRSRHSPASFIAHRRPIAERPASVADRQTFGNWEADVMQFGRTGQTVLALHERQSRLPSWGRCRRSSARRSRSTMAQSSLTTMNSTPGASRRSSAIPTRRGRREAWRTL